MSIYTPYTYLIGWTGHNKWYYGVRYARGCSPTDLWNTYFTSSKVVKQLRNEIGEPDVVEVRKTFTSGEVAKAWEDTVLRRMNVVTEDKWLNITHSHFNGIVITEEIHAKMVKANRKNAKRPEVREKISKSKTGIAVFLSLTHTLNLNLT